MPNHLTGETLNYSSYCLTAICLVCSLGERVCLADSLRVGAIHSHLPFKVVTTEHQSQKTAHLRSDRCPLYGYIIRVSELLARTGRFPALSR